MFTLNHVMLIGFVGQDPEVQTDVDKASFTRLQLASHSSYYNKEGQRIKVTHWHTVFLRPGMGKAIAGQIKKGMRIYVQGELRTSDWKDHEGKIHRSTAVYAHDCQILASQDKESDMNIP